MKAIPFLLLLYCIGNTCVAQQTTFKNGERVYAASIGLLNIRDSASLTSQMLAKLSLGDTAYIIENTSINCPLVNLFVKDTIVANDSSYNENPVTTNLSLQGQWVKIKYKNFVGFVNGIYLSSLPNFNNLERKYKPRLTINNVNKDALSDIHFYLLNKHYGIAKNAPQLKPAALLYKKKYIKKDEITEIKYGITYKDGLSFKYEDAYMETGVGGYTIFISKKGISFAEAIMYGRAFFYFDDASGIPNTKLGFFYDAETKKYSITRHGEGGGCDAQIYKNNQGEWVISFGCGGC